MLPPHKHAQRRLNSLARLLLFGHTHPLPVPQLLVVLTQGIATRPVAAVSEALMVVKQYPAAGAAAAATVTRRGTAAAAAAACTRDCSALLTAQLVAQALTVAPGSKGRHPPMSCCLLVGASTKSQVTRTMVSKHIVGVR